jgi:hypothetical protein
MKTQRGRRKTPPEKDGRPRILVLCEGRCTEPQYLRALRSKLRIPEQNLRILGPPEVPNTPREMVEEAKCRRRDKQESWDQVWCVFDTETKLTQSCREGLKEAVNSAEYARGSRIELAISNPCFEIWLLWHKENQSAWIASDAVQRRCAELGLTQGQGKDGKHIQDAETLVQECYEAAKNRACNSGQFLILKKEAITGDQAHERSGTEKPEDKNPSSGMYRLIDAIYAAFPPRE